MDRIILHGMAVLSQQLQCENKETCLWWAHAYQNYNFNLVMSHLTHAMLLIVVGQAANPLTYHKPNTRKQVLRLYFTHLKRMLKIGS